MTVGRPRLADAGFQHAPPRQAKRGGELAVEITIRTPDGASAADLRERQFATIVRLLRRSSELRQQRPRAA